MNGGENMWHLSKSALNEIKKEFNPFWQNVISSWASLCEPLTTAPSDILSQPLFLNENIMIDGKTAFYKSWIQNNVFFINDLIKENGEFYNYDEFIRNYNIKTTFLEFYGLILALPKEWKNIIHSQMRFENDMKIIKYILQKKFTVMNVDKFDPLTSLCISDIILKTDYAILRLKESKTDPFRKGIDIKLFKIDNSICPFLALKRYLSIRHSEFGIGFPSDPLFITGNREALTRQFFLVKLKNILELCGYDPNLYNGHSFRSGAATSAGKHALEDHMIKVLGRWKSDSYCRYIKISPTSIKYAQQSLTES
ncbi:unnamed protein product [Mytilus edulis]|uniref:Tyr recombinase domain-containing protein n=1 Tax=Mytilus edulis TaxID=6550 RepID=A0A8S3UQ58_MYTED|nr:unnamed protein product [Mytilus edulis]